MGLGQEGSNPLRESSGATGGGSQTAPPASNTFAEIPLSTKQDDVIQRLDDLLDHGVLPTQHEISTAIEILRSTIEHFPQALFYLKRTYIHLEAIRSETGQAAQLSSQIRERISSLSEGLDNVSKLAEHVLRTISPNLLHTRNIGIIAHVDAGKTTLSDRIFVAAGLKPDFGNIEAGTTSTDVLDEEKRRGMSIVAVAKAFDWRGYETAFPMRRINLIDTPGHFELQSEVRRSLSVLGGAVVVIDAKKGVEINTRTAWRHADNFHLPRICFFNKLDDLSAEPESAWKSLKKFLSEQTPSRDAVPLQWPIYRDQKLFGIVDLITLKVHHADGKRVSIAELDELTIDERKIIDGWRENLCLTIASQCPELEDLVMGGSAITREQIDSVVRARTLSGNLIPVLFGSALTNIGVHPLLDAVSKYLPSESDPKVIETEQGPSTVNPDPTAPALAYVFGQSGLGADGLTWLRVFSGSLEKGTKLKNCRDGNEVQIGKIGHLLTGAQGISAKALPGEIVTVQNLTNVHIGDTLGSPAASTPPLKSLDIPPPLVLYNIEPAQANDRSRFLPALREFARTDAALVVREETGKVIIGGSGELHLSISLERFKRVTNIEAKLSEPEVRYIGRITKPFRLSLDRTFGSVVHKVDLEVSPAKTGAGFSINFDNARLEQPATKKDFDTHFFVSVRRGVQEALQGQIAINAPTLDVHVEVHELVFRFGGNVDEAFHRTSAECTREACRKAGLELLEPIMAIQVYCDENDSHKVQADLMRRQAEVSDMHEEDGQTVIAAHIPASKILHYGRELQVMTHGTGIYTAEFIGYKPMNHKDQEALVKLSTAVSYH